MLTEQVKGLYFLNIRNIDGFTKPLANTPKGSLEIQSGVPHRDLRFRQSLRCRGMNTCLPRPAIPAVQVCFSGI